MQGTSRTFRLSRENDKVLLSFEGSEEKTPVRLVWARPITGRGREIGVLGRDKKELATLESMDDLDPESRRIAEEELSRRYLVPRITRVLRTRAHFGVRYWRVLTDIGERRFALKNASRNAVWVTDERLVLHDTLGCRYEISPFSSLDERSRAEALKVI